MVINVTLVFLNLYNYYYLYNNYYLNNNYFYIIIILYNNYFIKYFIFI